jgi:hypothetical protein
LAAEVCGRAHSESLTIALQAQHTANSAVLSAQVMSQSAAFSALQAQAQTAAKTLADSLAASHGAALLAMQQMADSGSKSVAAETALGRKQASDEAVAQRTYTLEMLKVFQGPRG